MRIKTKSGFAKVIGTIVCVCGAMLLSFYHGHTIDLGESKIHWPYVEKMIKETNPANHQGNRVLGSILLLFSSFAWALWFVIQVSYHNHNHPQLRNIDMDTRHGHDYMSFFLKKFKTHT